MVSSDFATNINFLENVHFTQKFYTKVFSFLTPSHTLFLEDKKDETNVYLIRKELFHCFDFGAFYEDMEEKSSGARVESYSLNFEGYLYGFLQKDDTTILERIIPICERIVLEDFNLLIDLEGNLTFERTARKTREEYIAEVLEEVGHPMHVDEIYDYIERKFPGEISSSDGIRGAFSKSSDLFIYFGRSSTYGLKKWEDEYDSIKGGTIRDIVEEYLQQFDEPKHISEIFAYVDQYRNTTAHNVLGNIKADNRSRFVFFRGAYVGLKGRYYDNVGSLSELNDRTRKRIPKESLINAYYELKEILGHIPTYTEMEEQGKYSASVYSRRFGGWRKFLNSLGEGSVRKSSSEESARKSKSKNSARKRISKEELIAAYYELKETLGRTPTTKEINKLGKYSVPSYYSRFGGWREFLESIGETEIRYNTIAKENLIEAYYELKQELGRIPTIIEMKKYGKYSLKPYYNTFDNWKRFLKSLGEVEE